MGCYRSRHGVAARDGRRHARHRRQGVLLLARFQSVDNQLGPVSGTSVPSDKYSVVGYDEVGSSASRLGNSLGLVMVAVSIIAVAIRL